MHIVIKSDMVSEMIMCAIVFIVEYYRCQSFEGNKSFFLCRCCLFKRFMFLNQVFYFINCMLEIKEHMDQSKVIREKIENTI